MSASKGNKSIMITNRRATHDYAFLMELEAGMVLTGTEIKSIRAGYANLTDAYCIFEHGELYVKNMNISEYANGSYYNHEAKRNRKLLLRKNELRKFERKLKEKGTSIIPYKLYISERGFAKLLIALAQGKKSFDKRESIKERDVKRDIDKVMKAYKNR
ncbi:MAG: SsrA-binding protein SmpB [Saprospiraceae bacterium]|jgi:SsrA-binding protein